MSSEIILCYVRELQTHPVKTCFRLETACLQSSTKNILCWYFYNSLTKSCFTLHTASRIYATNAQVRKRVGRPSRNQRMAKWCSERNSEEKDQICDWGIHHIRHPESWRWDKSKCFYSVLKLGACNVKILKYCESVDFVVTLGRLVLRSDSNFKR